MQMYHLFRDIHKVWSTDFSTAIICGDDSKTISYAELSGMIRSVANEIRQGGIRNEQNIRVRCRTDR